jgi:hypothetical protein
MKDFVKGSGLFLLLGCMYISRQILYKFWVFGVITGVLTYTGGYGFFGAIGWSILASIVALGVGGTILWISIGISLSLYKNY